MQHCCCCSIMEEIIKHLRGKNFVLIDCEYIQTSASHQCVRTMYMLHKNGFTCKYIEFYACKRYRELEAKYKKTFRYCQKHIHLNYEPVRSRSHHLVLKQNIFYTILLVRTIYRLYCIKEV